MYEFPAPSAKLSLPVADQITCQMPEGKVVCVML